MVNPPINPRRVQVGWTLSQIISIEESDSEYIENILYRESKWAAEVFLRASWVVRNGEDIFKKLRKLAGGSSRQPPTKRVLEKENVHQVKEIWWPKIVFANIQHPPHDKKVEERVIIEPDGDGAELELCFKYEVRIISAFKSLVQDNHESALHIEVISQLRDGEVELVPYPPAANEDQFSRAYSPLNYEIGVRKVQTLDEFHPENQERNLYRRQGIPQVFLVVKIRRVIRNREVKVAIFLVVNIVVAVYYTYCACNADTSEMTNELAFITGFSALLFAFRQLLDGDIPQDLQKLFFKTDLTMCVMSVLVLIAGGWALGNDNTGPRCAQFGPCNPPIDTSKIF